MTEYDVVVIGAGPGGSMAAKTAAELGLSVLLIEKRQEIGTPVRCAEGISKKSLEELVDVNKKWIAAEVIGAKIYAPDGTEIILAEKEAGSEVGYVLERKLFDRYLAKMAAKQGADVMVKTTAIGIERVKDRRTVNVKMKKIGEEFTVETKIVIGADGVESRVGKWVGIDTTLKLDEIESCVQYLMSGIEFEPEYCHFWLGTKIAPGGYVWLFPKGKKAANVGTGVLPSLAQKTPKEYLDTFIKEKFGDGEIVEIVAGGVPVKGPIESAVADNVMLVGDAARHADPITGGGIANAMKGGVLAGRVAAEAIKKRDYSKSMLKKYDELWKKEFGKKLQRNKILQLKLLKMSDEDLNSLAHSLFECSFKKMTVREIIIELIKRNPKILWDLKDLFLK